MTDKDNIVTALVNRAKETTDAALVAALQADFQVTVGPERITVVNPSAGEIHRIRLDEMVPVGCENLTEKECDCECTCDSGEVGKADFYGPCVPADDGEGEGDDTDGDDAADDGREPPCPHEVAALSYLLNNVGELLTAIQRFNDRQATLSVGISPVGCANAHDMRAIQVTNDRAADVKVATDDHDRTLVEYWAVEYGVMLDPNSRVVLVEIDGGPRRDPYPAEVLYATA